MNFSGAELTRQEVQSAKKARRDVAILVMSHFSHTSRRRCAEIHFSCQRSTLAGKMNFSTLNTVEFTALTKVETRAKQCHWEMGVDGY